MNVKKRQERDRDLFLYRMGWDGDKNHTLFETALRFELSVNQIFRNERKFAHTVLKSEKEEGANATMEKFQLTELQLQQIKNSYNLEELHEYLVKIGAISE